MTDLLRNVTGLLTPLVALFAGLIYHYGQAG
jgi:hypothetical protein